MKFNFILLFFVFGLSGCQTLQDFFNGSARRDKEWAEEQARIAHEKSEKERLKEQQEQERLQARLDKRNLKNTVFLEPGWGQKKVLELLDEPNTTSANNGELIWTYELFEYPNINAQIFPFDIVFKNGKITRFGINQEQHERNIAIKQGKVSIQKQEQAKPQ